MSALRIGIDVGGTNTDAVLLGAAGVLLARTKTPTTEDPIDGIAKALGEVVGPHANEISTVSLGTTHA
ncbi:MAG: ROK family protein, partial [Thermoleophilia bacterium]|nr:ROK family protein [Thermoleophilia bacterium]